MSIATNTSLGEVRFNYFGPTCLADPPSSTRTTGLSDNRNGYGTFGTVKFPSGASFTGEVAQGEGRYTPSPESVLTAFTGWVFGVGTANPQPSEGVFEFKTGDSFTGTLSGSQAHGIYMSADGSRRFVGTLIIDTASPRPVAGIVEDRNRRLLAVVREPRD